VRNLQHKAKKKDKRLMGYTPGVYACDKISP